MARGGTRFRLRRARGRLRRRGQRGVVAVVGTLLSLLVFFALFGIFLTQYVPLWMDDNEAAFTAQTQESFANLKSEMDLQATFGTAPVLSTPFVMSSQGIAIFAQPTAGTLNFIPDQPGVFANVTTSIGPGDSHAFYQNYTLGTLHMDLPNRYFTPQEFELEDDGVIQSQSDTHELLDFPPILSYNITGTNVGVTLGLFQMVGNATQAISSGTEQVYSHFKTAQTYYVQAPTGTTFTATYTIGTHYACAWQQFFNESYRTSGFPVANATLTPNTCVASMQTAQDVVLTLRGLSSCDLIVAAFQMVVGVGVE